MDPTDTLDNIRRLVGLLQGDLQMLATSTDAADRLAEYVDDLDQWMTLGGFMPQQWQGGRS